MKKKQENYYLLGRKTARKSFKGNFVLYFKHLVYLFGTIFSMLSIVFYPIARVAKENIGKELKDNGNYQLGDVFDELESKNKIWRVLIIHAIRVLVIFTLILIGLYLSNVFVYLVTVIHLALPFEILYFELYFIIPLWIIIGISSLVLFVKTEVGLKVVTNDDYTVSEAFRLSNKVVGAKEVFKVLVYFVSNAIEFIIYGAIAFLFVDFIGITYGNVISLGLAIVLGVVLVFILIKRLLAIELSISYYLDNVVAVKNIDIQVEVIDYQAVRKKEILSLFNDNEVL